MTIADFTEWLAKKPPQGTYNYRNPVPGSPGCLVAQFLQSKGLDPDCVGQWTWRERGGLQHRPIPHAIAMAAYAYHPKSWTYGKALKRLRAYVREEAA